MIDFRHTPFRPSRGILGCGLVLTAAAAMAQSSDSNEADTISARMAKATTAFLAGLAEPAKGRATTEFEDPERRTWAFGPVQREGVALGDLSTEDMKRLDTLLETAFTDAGMRAWREIRALESVLRELESRPDRPATHRDPDLYWLRVYGTPSEEARWSWRFEGHHLALHVACAPGATPTVTPFFLGANPLFTGEKDEPAVELFVELESNVNALIKALGEQSRTPDQESRPGDVRMAPGQDELPPPGGADIRKAGEDVQENAVALLNTYLALLEPELRTFDAARALKADGDVGLHFAQWGGASVREERTWSLRAPTFCLELATTSGPHHVHILLRDESADFGGPAK